MLSSFHNTCLKLICYIFWGKYWNTQYSINFDINFIFISSFLINILWYLWQ
jgi:hypothetical protein